MNNYLQEGNTFLIKTQRYLQNDILVICLIFGLAFGMVGCAVSEMGSRYIVSEQNISDIRGLLQVIDNANRMKFNHDGIFATNVEDLIDLQYLAVDSSMYQQFDLKIHIIDSQHRLVEAWSRSSFQGGRGWIFRFEPIKNEYTVEFHN